MGIALIDQDKIHRKVMSLADDQREEAASQLGDNFPILPNKDEAWSDLTLLIKDLNNKVQFSAAESMIMAFKSMAAKENNWNKDVAWNNLHTLLSDPNESVRISTATIVGSIFNDIPDKKQAWNDLIILIKDKNSIVRRNAEDAIKLAFSHLPRKERALRDLIRLALDKDSDTQLVSTSALIANFKYIADKQSIWEEMHQLIENEDKYIRWNYAKILGAIFYLIPDRDSAWKDLIRLAHDNNDQVKSIAADSLVMVIELVTDKDQAWTDLIELIMEDSHDLRKTATNALYKAATNVYDKDRAWEDLIRLVGTKDEYVREKAAEALETVFNRIKNKNRAWKDLIELTDDPNGNIRNYAIDLLSQMYDQISDKEEAWCDLIQLTKNRHGYVREKAVDALGSAFRLVKDKEKAWNDLHLISLNQNSRLLLKAVYAIEKAFEYIPDKEMAWDDTIRLIKDNNKEVRYAAADALYTGVLYISDKERAWKDLIDLTDEENSYILWNTVRSIEKAFSLVTNKDKAWKDLIKLTHSENPYVRQTATMCLGLAFTYVPNKNICWTDIMELTNENDCYVRAFAYHSLGRASIFKATESKTEKEIKEQLENAIGFFNESLSEEGLCKPSKFCLPFYKSFYAITFGNIENKYEVERYLAEARNAIEGSKIRESLLEAVENLSKALLEVQKSQSNAGELTLDLKACKDYCDKADHLLDAPATKQMSPIATKLIRIGKPIIKKNIKKIIEDISEKSRVLNEDSKGTRSEELTAKLLKMALEIKELNEQRESESIKGRLKNSQFLILLKDICLSNTSYEKREEALRLVEEAENEKDIDMQIEKIGRALSFCNYNSKFAKFLRIILSEYNQDTVRVATVQIDFNLMKGFPPRLANKENTKKKILVALEKANFMGANIVCLPELCICIDWINEMKDRFSNMVIVSGSCYDEKNRNVCSVLNASEENIPPQIKITPSKFESPKLTGEGMVSGPKELNIYETEFGKFSILICRDFLNYCQQAVMEDLDFVFVPSFNPAVQRFQEYANIQVENHPIYIILSNTASLGGTAILGQLDKDYFDRLVQNGCKNEGDETFKICELERGTEGIIIADFNLGNKSILKPTPAGDFEERATVTNIKKIVLRF